MKRELIDKELVKRFMGAPRRADTDKRDYGDLLVFAGKEGMAGAAILAAKAALRSGVGLVKVATPRSNFPIIQRTLPEAICLDEEAALSDLRHYTAIVVGPGMGADDRTEQVVEAVLERAPLSTPILVDADGLNAIAASEELKGIFCGRGNMVITPHKREAARLLGCEYIAAGEREAACVELAETFNCVALLKGSGTLITTPGSNAGFTAGDEPSETEQYKGGEPSIGIIYQNTTGNPGMATAGSGDVLSGIIGALMAQGTAPQAEQGTAQRERGAEQGMAPLYATICGAFVHGLAGDLAAEKLGERSIIASDIIDNLPAAFESL